VHVCVCCSLETGSAVSEELMCLTGACVCVCCSLETGSAVSKQLMRLTGACVCALQSGDWQRCL